MGLLLVLGGWGWWKFVGNKNKEIVSGYIKNVESMVGEEFVPTPIVSEKIIKLITPTIKPTIVGDTAPWGVSSQVSEHSWTMKIGMDAKMGTPGEILAALNIYRQKKGSQVLVWDDNLGKFAQDRADYLATIESTDGHKGFEDYLKNEDGYVKLGFNWLGENISYGYKLEGVHIIEWMYAGDRPHDDNQSDPKWDHVGIGVKGTATCLVLATAKR